MKVVGGSAKVRVGGPSEDRADLKDEELRKGCWTGAVSLSSFLGDDFGKGEGDWGDLLTIECVDSVLGHLGRAGGGQGE